ncbi:M23 family metallopeptidase [Bradyrhizobium sp. CSA112]|uniref:M23 family metallopeptidase n=1 Tax=Bradyrhizobium sp. CSA112 TaxID=2699170 RepID=UPI00319DD483
MPADLDGWQAATELMRNPPMIVQDFMRGMTRAFAIAAAFGFSSEVIAQSIQLGMPIACEPGRTCYIQNYVDVDPSASTQDYKCGTLTYDAHNGTDFRLPSLASQKAGVEVLAAASGRVLRTRGDAPDGAFSKSAREAVRDVECGNGAVIEHPEHWETQYCHMASGSLMVKPGDLVKAGQPLGRVGLSGMTEYPHLHFTVRHKGAIVDPFAYGAPADSCGSGALLWHPALHAQLAYQERVVINAGFANGPVTMELIEDGSAGKELPSAGAAAIVAFVRVIGLKTGDTQRLVVKDPTGNVIAENRASQLDKNKAQYLLFTGKRRPATGWERGTYKAMYVVERDGRVVLQRDLEFTL